jgi:hypothetical protein
MSSLNSENVELVKKRGRGRPRRIREENEEPKKYYYYVPLGTKPTGRPRINTDEERKQKQRELERQYNLRRGKFIIKIKYYIEHYDIPTELKEMKQETNEEVYNKFDMIYDYVLKQKKDKITNTMIKDTKNKTESSCSKTECDKK